MTNWVLVADKTQVIIYQVTNKLRKLVEVQTIHNPDGRKRERELVSDGPGQGQNSSALSGHRSIGKENTATEHVLEVFTQQVAQKVKRAHEEKHFEEFMVVAGPETSGVLSKQLDKQGLTPLKFIHKNYTNLRPQELDKKLHDDLFENFFTLPKN